MKVELKKSFLKELQKLRNKELKDLLLSAFNRSNLAHTFRK